MLIVLQMLSQCFQGLSMYYLKNCTLFLKIAEELLGLHPYIHLPGHKHYGTLWDLLLEIHAEDCNIFPQNLAYSEIKF